MAGKTVERVPLIRVGTWSASTGEASITLEDLKNIVAAYESGDLDPAVIKIGHTDPRFENPDWDGEPAYGQVTNLELDEDEKGGTLYGDYVNVPVELAEKLDSAYPFRSAEIDWGVELLDETGAVTATYPAVLTGLALLGRSAPAVKGLGTVHSGFRAKRTGEKQTVFTASVFSLNGGHTSNSLRKTLQDAIEVQAEAGGADRWGRWIVDFDDEFVWYEDGPSGVYQQGYTTAQDGAVALDGAPVPVVEKRVFTPASDTASVPHSQFANAEPSGVNTPARAVKQNTEGEEAAMAKLNDAQLAKLRTMLGLSETAPEAEVLTALAADGSEQEAPAEAEAPAAAQEAEGTEDENEDEDEQEAPAEAEAPAAPAAAEEPTETVKLSAAAFAELQASNKRMATQLAELTKQKDAERRDGLIKTALAAGRLHKTEVAKWREALDQNEEVTASLLSERAAVFPVTELGHAAAPAAFSAGDAVSDALIQAENKLFNIGGK